jgi:hypothetical protein
MRPAPAAASPAPPPLLLVHATVAMRKTFAGDWLLPTVDLVGAFTPEVALAGALVLPAFDLAGGLSYEVDLSAASLVLPSLEFAGDLAHDVDPLGAALLLPALAVSGSFTPAVELGAAALVLPSLELSGAAAPEAGLAGGLVLPAIDLAGSFEPVASLAASALALPSLQVAGAFAPTVGVLGGALALPSLQVAGSVTPAAALSGSLALPSLQLAGAVTPAFALAGALVLPKLQLAGTLAPSPVVLAASTLTLPSLQLAGSFTVSTSSVGSWLRLAASTPTAGRYDTVANVLVPSNPAVQTVAGRRPSVAASANGLPCASYDGSDYWLLPIVASNNNPAVFGLHVYVKLTNTGARQRLVHAFFGAAGPRVIFDVVGNGILIQACSVYPNGMQYEKTNFLTVGVWTSLLFMINANGAANTDKLWVKKDGVLQTGGTFYLQGTGDMSVLATTTGSYQLGASSESDTPGSPMVAGTLTGPNWHLYNALPTVAATEAVRLFEVPT